MEQVFFDHLEVWDQEAGELIEQFADPASVDRDRYDLAVRLCYRASWDTKEGQAQHWVDYPKTADVWVPREMFPPEVCTVVAYVPALEL